MQQAQDFLDESEALYALLSTLVDTEFDQATLFKDWTITDILRHLHVWNLAVKLSLTDETAFAKMLARLMGGEDGVKTAVKEREILSGISGQQLLADWIDSARDVAVLFAKVDPKARLKWVGPDMSAISSISSRLMETWAHALAIYDLLGVDRQDTDRISNIARLGVNTFGWTYMNREMPIPETVPYVKLTAPSGIIWEYGEPQTGEVIEGSASEFCQIVTQCRNVADTQMSVTGKVANEWMAIAQCFAGRPNDPPAKGARGKRG